MGDKPATKKRKIVFTPAMDKTLLETYLRVGANWREIERVMRSCHFQEIVERTPEEVIELLCHHWTWLQKKQGHLCQEGKVVQLKIVQNDERRVGQARRAPYQNAVSLL
jgi:hypothetical protein